jgi:hypothetical protein
VSRAARRTACVLLLGLTLALGGLAGTASASTPSPSGSLTVCANQVINDWYLGSIPTTFAVGCYQQAIKILPTANQLYTSARDDITRAMQVAIVRSSANGTTTTKITSIKSNGKHILLATQQSGPPPSQLDSAASTSSGVTSFPLPLLILGGLAILLVAAGGIGLLIRRFQGQPPADTA